MKKNKYGLYPDVIKIAKDLISNDQCFDRASWSVDENQRFGILRGVLLFYKNFDTKIPIEFRILIPKQVENPRKHVQLYFTFDQKTRHYTVKFKLKEYILGVLAEKLRKNDYV